MSVAPTAVHGGPLKRMSAVYVRHARELLHSVPGWFDMLFWPLMDLVIWGTLMLFIQRQDANLTVPVAFLVGGVLLWDIVFRSNLGVGLVFLDDTSWSHNIVNFLVSPLRAGEYLAAALAWAMTKVFAGWTVMVVASAILFAFTPFDLGLSLAAFMLVLMLFGVALALLVLGIILRFGQGADILAWGLAVLLLPVSAVFYPVAALPGWAQAIANALPSAHVFEAMRTVLAGDPMPWGRLWIALGLDAAYLVLTLLFAARMFQTLRRRGYVTRYMT